MLFNKYVYMFYKLIPHFSLGNAHLNVFDGDEFDMRVRDVPKEHWQSKHKRRPKNLNELLNDKSHINEIKSKYQEYKCVSLIYI